MKPILLTIDVGEQAWADLRWVREYYQRSHGLSVSEAMIVRRALETLRRDLARIAQAKVRS